MRYYAIRSTEPNKTERKLVVVSLSDNPERGLGTIMITNLGKLVIEEVEENDLEGLMDEYGYKYSQ